MFFLFLLSPHLLALTNTAEAISRVQLLTRAAIVPERVVADCALMATMLSSCTLIDIWSFRRTGVGNKTDGYTKRGMRS